MAKIKYDTFKKNTIAKKASYFIAISIFIIIVFPQIMLLVLSFAKNWRWPNILPKEFSSRSWKHFFNPASKSLKALLSSTLVSICTTFLTFFITLPAAKSISFYNFRFKKFFTLLFFLPLIIPPVTIAMGLHIQFIKLNLANSFFGVVFINIFPCIPYAFFILKSGFDLLGQEFELQAKTLGANSLEVLIFITLPLLFPSILTASVMVFIISFSQYFLTFCIGGGQIITFPLLMIPFIQSGDRMLGSVFSIVFIFVMFLLLIITENIIKSIYKKRKL